MSNPQTPNEVDELEEILEGLRRWAVAQAHFAEAKIAGGGKVALEKGQYYTVENAKAALEAWHHRESAKEREAAVVEELEKMLAEATRVSPTIQARRDDEIEAYDVGIATIAAFVGRCLAAIKAQGEKDNG